MRINTRSFTPAQNLVGEAVGAPGESCLWFFLVADPANTGAQPTYGGTAATCLLPLDFNFPPVPGEHYQLNEVFAKTNAGADKVILTYITSR